MAKLECGVEIKLDDGTYRVQSGTVRVSHYHLTSADSGKLCGSCYMSTGSYFSVWNEFGHKVAVSGDSGPAEVLLL